MRDTSGQHKDLTGLVRLRTFVPLLLALISILAGCTNSGTPSRASAPATTPPHIEVTGSALQHITDRHTVGGTTTAGKSVFNSGEDIQSLIKNAEAVTPVEQANGNLQRVVNAGRSIGTDRSTGRQTSTYTVITTESGDLVTAFPGLP